jgi:2-polyprenyl-3-methyl-5-hydroxy-6-metoxy-1,4-benzoquinol methylase
MDKDYRDDLYLNYFKDRYDQKSIIKKLKSDSIQLENEVLKYIPNNKSLKILEIACGHGNLLYLLKQKGFNNVYGIDISEDQINMAKSLGIENAEVADLNVYLSNKINEFDVVIGIDIIEHLKKDELINCLKLIKKSLKHDGVTIFRTPNADGIGNTLFSAGDFSHEVILNKLSAIQIAKAANFNNIKVFSSFVYIDNPMKELLRKFIWPIVLLRKKIELFSAGLGTSNTVFTPNLLIIIKNN